MGLFSKKRATVLSKARQRDEQFNILETHMKVIARNISYMFCVGKSFKIGLNSRALWEPTLKMMEQAKTLITKPMPNDNWSQSRMFADSGEDFMQIFSSSRREDFEAASALEADPLSGIRDCLVEHLSKINVEIALQRACDRCEVDPGDITTEHLGDLVKALEFSLQLFLDAGEYREVVSELRKIGGVRKGAIASIGLDYMSNVGEAVTFNITDDQGIVDARTGTVACAEKAGLCRVDAVKVATVVSELSRNMLRHAKGGTLTVIPLRDCGGGIEIIAEDKGPGIDNLEEVLNGQGKSGTGVGIGLDEIRRLMTTFKIETEAGKGTTVTTTFVSNQ